MRTIKTYAFSLFLLISFTMVNAQKFDYEVDINVNDFKLLEKRKIAVEIIESNGEAESYIQKWSGEDRNWLARYQGFIKSYNTNMQVVMKKYWNLSENVEFKKTKEIEELIKKRDKNYLILRPEEQNASKQAGITKDRSGVIVLVLGKCDRGEFEKMYMMPLPHAMMRDDQVNPLSDYIFSVRFMVNHIQYMMEKKGVNSIEDYMVIQKDNNCVKLNDANLQVDQDIVKDFVNKKSIKSEYKRNGGFELVDTKSVNESVQNEEANQAYMIVLPYTTAQNFMDMGAVPTVICYKLLVSTSNAEILGYTKNKPRTGTDISVIDEKDFKEWDNCSAGDKKEKEDRKRERENR